MPKRIPSAEGAVLRLFRSRRGMTLEELAAREGISPRTLERLENGSLRLERERLLKILAHVEVPSEAVETALLADELANPTGGKGASQEDGLIEKAVAAGARAGARGARAAHAELKARLLRRKAPRHRQWAKDRWTHLKKLAAGDQEMAVNALLDDERSWALAERLCLASMTSAANRADEALRLARLALRLAEHVPDEEFRPAMQGWAETFMANAQMVAGDHAASAWTLAHADELWEQGAPAASASLLNAAQRLDLKASLLTCHGRFEEVHVLIADALRRTRTHHTRGRLLLKKARALEVAGEYEAALEVLEGAKPHLDSQDDPRLLLSYYFKRAVCYCHLDRHDEAVALLPLVEKSIDPGHELDCVRLDWLQGRIWAGLGRRPEAVAALARARDYFLSEEIAYDYAMVSVELGTVLLEEGRTRQVGALAEEMMWIFRSQGIHEKALEALSLFYHSARAEHVQVDWARRLLRYLYRAQNDRELKFQP